MMSEWLICNVCLSLVILMKSDKYDILMTDKSEEFANVNLYLFVWFSGLKVVTMQGAVREP